MSPSPPAPPSTDPWGVAARAAAVPLLAVLGGAVGSLAADALSITGGDARFSAVGLGLALPLWLAHLLRPGARGRALVLALGLPWAWVLVDPRAVFPLTWLSGGILAMGILALAHAARSAWALGASTASRLGLSLLAAGPGAYLWLAAAVVLVNTQMVIAPVRLAHQRPRVEADERLVSLRTEDGYRLEGTYTTGAPGAGGVLLVHGVADGRDRWLPWVSRLRAMRQHVLRIDLRAHGRSEGAVVTYGQREVLDARAGLAWLRRQPGVDGAALVMVGTSMGGGIVLAASSAAEVRAAIALAPTSSYPPLVAQRTALLGPLAGPVLHGSAVLATAMGQTPMTAWRPAARMSTTLPILVAHGTSDRTVPLSLSRALGRAHDNVTLLELACGHDEIPRVAAEDPSWGRIAAFLAAHGPLPSSQ